MAQDFEDAWTLVRAGARVLHIASYEWERVQGWCIAFADRMALPLRIWSSSSGLVELQPGGERKPLDDDQPSDILLTLADFAEADDGQLLLVEDIQPYLEPQNHAVIRQVREACRPRGSTRLLVLSTPVAGLPQSLRKEVPTIDLPLPGVVDLRQVAVDVAADLGVPFDPAPELFDAARGLTVMEARLAFGQAAVREERLGLGQVPLIAREKERVIRQSGVLDYYEPNSAMRDVGGLDALKTWLDRRGNAFSHSAREFGLDAPKGVLLLGVQGCGKSLVAKAIAATWHFPLLRFDLGKVFGGLVGQSEGNIRTALDVAEALAPCVLWIDEIEKGLAGMGSSDQTDGGTTARVVGTLLTWMQEKEAPVFVVATANRIELLPPELLRKGRFDEIFFVDLPTPTARAEILSIHLKKKDRQPADFDLDQLVKASVGFSGAELQEAVHEGLFEAFAGEEELKTTHIENALAATTPLSRTMAEQIEHLRKWARVRARLAAGGTGSEVEPLGADGQADVPRLPQERRNPFVPGGSA